MTKFMIGRDYAGVGSVKITKGSYDPVNTPDSDIWKFNYNSKWAANIRFNGIYIVPADTSPGPTYYPSPANWTYWHAYFDPDQWTICRRSFFGILSYSFPLFDARLIDSSTGYYSYGQLTRRDIGWQQTSQQYNLRSNNTLGWYDAGATYTIANNTISPGDTSYMLSDVPSIVRPLIVWDLPGDETGLLNSSPLPAVSGHQQVRISATELRVSKPGFDARYASGTQLAFDASNIPAKIIAAADIAVPNGTSYYEVGINLPARTVIDLHYYEAGGAIYYPCPPLTRNFGAMHWIYGSRVYFYNANEACRARFLVIAADDNGITTGTNVPIRQFTSGSEQVVQLVRPGSAASPSFGDIVLDSRWPCLQLIQTGVLGVAAGAQQQTVSYSAPGMFVFVKFCTIHGGGNYYGRVSFNKMVRCPQFSFWRYFKENNPNSGWQDWRIGGDSSYVRYDNTSATFFTYRGQPIYGAYSNSDNYSSGNLSYTYDAGEIYGLRYYVFGVPL